jgi:hypothetical protein
MQKNPFRRRGDADAMNEVDGHKVSITNEQQ